MQQLHKKIYILKNAHNNTGLKLNLAEKKVFRNKTGQIINKQSAKWTCEVCMQQKTMAYALVLFAKIGQTKMCKN